MWSSEHSQRWENFFGIIVLQFVGHHPVGIEFDFIVIAALLLSCCSFFFVFGRGVSFFGGFQRPPVSGYSADSYSSAALAGDEHTSFYPTILTGTSVFFTNVLWSSVCKFFTSLMKLMSKYFIFEIVILKSIFQFPFWYFIVGVKKCSWFLSVNLVSCYLAGFFFCSRSFCVSL